MATSAVTTVRIWAVAYHRPWGLPLGFPGGTPGALPSGFPYKLLADSSSSTVYFEFNEAPLASSFSLSDCTTPAGTYWADDSLTRDPHNAKRYWAKLTAHGDAESERGRVGLNLANITDQNGNAGSGTYYSPEFTVDTKRPQDVRITIDDTDILSGETATVTFVFNTKVTSYFQRSLDLSKARGELTDFVTADGGLTWTAKLTPALANTNASDCAISLKLSQVFDVGSNRGLNATPVSSNVYTVHAHTTVRIWAVADGFPPDLPGGFPYDLRAYSPSSKVYFEFNETPLESSFSLSDCTIPAGTSWVNGSLTRDPDNAKRYWATLTAHENVETERDRVGLNLANITYENGNAGSGTCYSGYFTVDTKRPQDVRITLDDTELLAGEITTVTFVFDTKVSSYFHDKVDLSRAGGNLTNFVTADGGLTWTAKFTAVLSGTNSSHCAISLTLDQVFDMGGNTGLNPVPFKSSAYSVHTLPPTQPAVTSVRIWAEAYRSAPYDLRADSPSSKVYFEFNEEPLASSFSLSDCTAPAGTSWADGSLTRDLDNAKRYWATLTAHGDMEIGRSHPGFGLNLARITDRVSLNLANITDRNGNAGSGTYYSPGFTIDTKRPQDVRITIDDTRLLAGEIATVTFVFNTKVTSFHDKVDLSHAGGLLTNFVTADDGLTWTAKFTADLSSTNTSDCAISLNLSQVLDKGGNWGSNATPFSSNVYSVQTLTPTLPASGITFSDSALTLDQRTMTVTFTFSEPVKGFRSTNLQLSPGKGTLSPPVAQSPDASGHSAVWTATLTAPTGDDVPATRNNKITVNFTGMSDSDGNPVTGPLESSSTYAIDFQRPTVEITMVKTTLGIGDVGTLILRFSEKVIGLSLDDLRVHEDSPVRGTLSNLIDHDGGHTWLVTVTPQGYTENDGRKLSGNFVVLRRNSVTDEAGNQGPDQGDAYSPHYSVDHQGPHLRSGLPHEGGAHITFRPGEPDTILDAGETATISFSFNEPVTTLDASCISFYTITETGTSTDIVDGAGGTATSTTEKDIVDGSGGTVSNLISTDGGTSWTATLTAPTSTVAIREVNLGVYLNRVTDLSGNKGILPPSMSAVTGIKYGINTNITTGTRPSATIALADSSLTVGESTLVTITFNVRVNGLDATDVDLTDASGTLGTLSTADNGLTWTARFTPWAISQDPTNTIRLNLAGVTNDNGRTGQGTAVSSNYRVDTLPPTVTIWLDDTRLTAGESTTVTFSFHETVTGFTSDDIVLAEANGTLGPLTAHADGRTWTATFTPTANVEDSSNTIRVNLTGVTDAAGNAATGSLGSDNYTVDTRADTTAPQLIGTGDHRPNVTGNQLVLRFSDTGDLDANPTRKPAGGAFAVLVDGALNAVTNVSINGQNRTVTLTLSTAVIHGQSVTVAYTDPTTDDDTNAIQDTIGNDAASFAATAVTTITPDTAPPQLIITGDHRPKVTGNQLVLGFDDTGNLDADPIRKPANRAFTVLVEGVANAVTHVTIEPQAKTVTLTLSTAVIHGQSVTVAYADPTTGNDTNAIQDAAGNDATSFATTEVTNTTPADTTPPQLITTDDHGPKVTGNQLVLRFGDTGNLNADPTRKPANRAFTVLVEGVANAVTNVTIAPQAKTVTLTLSTALTHGQSVTVAYADPTAGNDANAIQDAAGNDAASFAATAVVNNTPDTTPPQLLTSGDHRPRVTGNQLVLRFGDTGNLDADLAHTPTPGAFTVLVEGVANAVTNVTVEPQAKTVTLTLTTALTHGQSVTVAYTDPTTGNDANAIQDATGNDATSFAATEVTNTTPAPADTTPPQPITSGDHRPKVTGNQLVLGFSDTGSLDANLDHKPAGGAFTVLVNGVANAVTNVTVEPQAKTVTLTLTTAVTRGQSVTVAYADPTTDDDTNAIQDATGNDAASFAATAVTNTTPADTTPPELITADDHRPHVTGNQLVLRFSDTGNLDADPTCKPANEAFAVLVEGVANAVTHVAVEPQDKTVTLTLSTAVSHGQSVTVAYADPTTDDDANAIQDAAGNDAASFAATTVTNTTPAPADTTPPELITTDDHRPHVTGNQLVLRFSDTGNLDADPTRKPANEAFTVLVEGVANAVTHVAVEPQEKTVTLTLSTAVSHGQSVTVAYADPTTDDDANAIQDAAGNDAARFAATTVTNTTPAPADTTPPELITTDDHRPHVTGNQLVLRFSDTGNLDADPTRKPANEAFAVLVEGVANAVTHVAVEPQDKTVTLTLSTAATHGQSVTVAYTDPTTDNDTNAIQDAAGNDAVSFAATTVTNTTPAPADTTPPELITTDDHRPHVTGNQLVLRFSDTGNLDADPTRKPANEAFTVHVDGVANAVTDVAVEPQDKTITLTLSTAVSHGQSVTVTYADPTTDDDANAIQDAAGNDAVSFAATVVVNNTPAPADTTPPQLITSGTAGPRVLDSDLVLEFSDASNLDTTETHKPLSGDFTVLVDGAANAVTSVIVGANSKLVYLTLSTPVRHAQSVSIAYNDSTPDDTSAIRDTAGNRLTSFPSTAVDNRVPDREGPQLITSGDTTRPRVNGDQLVLSFGNTDNLDADPIYQPESEAFAVLVDGAENAVTNVTVDARAKTVTLTLTTAVSHGQTVTVAYADPTTDDDANAIQDAAGNDAVSFAATEVLNNTPAPQGQTPSTSSAPSTLSTPSTPSTLSTLSAPAGPTDKSTQDTNSNGIPGSAKNQPPAGTSSPAGAAPVADDGNGDGIPDSTQAAVHSTRLVLSSPTGANQPADTASTPVTLVAGSQDGQLDPDSSGARITRLEQEDAPAELPQGMETPLGLLRFEATLATGRSSQTFSLYLDPALGVGGYWARDSAGNWVHLSSAPYGGKVASEGGRLRLDFEIADGGPFDADGQANGVITAPGVAARMPLSLVGQAPDAVAGLWF
ncbi:hypothetical protein D8B24_19460 [Verminephrobacter aporrectodeae subsp. tuberculatae]|uniref:SwmB domain-containing protein n=1 Tax=Verminephrobacter aporrectodeae TaxID=1110389 RepID=UPI00224387F4|nr:SwmB domain-containing protein [Verminephrobacter aporrectodeae]MCW8209144.1 hypothetical protein [Verminephrobacter aporrectodeae subsp. tuberculatae]